MKVLNEKKGFTLIELLAVIVVLAIVMVLAATTVLPYMANARKQAFATEAETVKKAASQAVSLIGIGSVTDASKYTKTTNGYCFTVQNLKDLGLFEKDDANYAGVVEVTKSGNNYTYLVKMKNSEFYVSQTTAGSINATSDVKDVTTGDAAKPTTTEVPSTCTSS
ncbi:MAG: type II secretion system protein [Firmicutes bacterium]|nr:type II secretion system protein [Bacillota bacterium]